MNVLKARKFSSVMSQLRFDGRVVLITGAGRGLGKEYALAFANRGAKVVINDLGGASDGMGQRHNEAADEVVQQIKANGGSAVANYDSVDEGEKIVKTAIDNYGRIDVLVNNAGILRDRSFQKMSNDDWSLVHKVHLSGAFKVTKAAWPYFKKQKFGRIIMTSSAAGIYGNFGQANYSAAKLGLLGLANTLAIEGANNNIFCNTIAPMAASRLTKNVVPEEVFNSTLPKFVAPFVLYLCHENCQENGALFETGAGWASRLRWQSTAGTQFRKWGNDLTPEMVKDHWHELNDWNDAKYPASAHESIMGITSSLREISADAKEIGNMPSQKSADLRRLIGKDFRPSEFSYTADNVILFALGVGVTIDKKTDEHLKHLYEGHEDFSVLPTFGVIPAQTLTFKDIGDGSFFDTEDLDVSQILHGEHYLELCSPLPAEGSFVSTGKISDVLDKGKGALLIIDCETKDEHGHLICKNQFSVYVNKAGGFGGKANSDLAKPLGKTPNRDPDKVVENVTSLEQAAIYRLSGDHNPLHIDPSFANLAGFKEPILHGLCAFGFAARNVLDAFANSDVKAFKCIKARFNKPVTPGQTLVTRMWKEMNRVHFEMTIKETGAKSIIGGYVDLHDDVKEPSPVATQLKSETVFNEIASRVQKVPDISKKINGIFVWKINQGEDRFETWVMDFKSSPAKIFKGNYDGNSDVQLAVSDDDFVAIASGQMNPQQAFFKGKLKITGNVMLSQKLGQIFNQQSKL